MSTFGKYFLIYKHACACVCKEKLLNRDFFVKSGINITSLAVNIHTF